MQQRKVGSTMVPRHGRQLLSKGRGFCIPSCIGALDAALEEVGLKNDFSHLVAKEQD